MLGGEVTFLINSRFGYYNNYISKQLWTSPSGGYTVQYVRNVAGQAKIYIRPMQDDMSINSDSCGEWIFATLKF